MGHEITKGCRCLFFSSLSHFPCQVSSPPPLHVAQNLMYFACLLGRLDKSFLTASPFPTYHLVYLGIRAYFLEVCLPIQETRLYEREKETEARKTNTEKGEPLHRIDLAACSWKENSVLMISQDLHVFDCVPSAEYCFCLGLNPQSNI